MARPHSFFRDIEIQEYSIIFACVLNCRQNLLQKESHSVPFIENSKESFVHGNVFLVLN
jgi:hypothetical protein